MSMEVPSRLENILLRYSSDLDLMYEKFLYGVIEQSGTAPVINLVDYSAVENINKIIESVTASIDYDALPDDFCAEDVQVNKSLDEEEVELL